MKLPNAKLALVARAKITDYLLHPAHPDNGGKATFFARLGFDHGDWQTLATALRRLALATPVTECLETAQGRKHVLDGELETPAGRSVRVRTVWIIDVGRKCPRFVTAYPSN